MKHLIMILLIVCIFSVGFCHAAEHSAVSSSFTLNTHTRLHSEVGNAFMLNTHTILHSAISNIYIQDTRNHPPVAMDDKYNANEDEALIVTTLNSVLANDTDAYVDDTLAVVAFDTTGSVGQVTDWNSDGSFVYNPYGQFESLAVDEEAKDILKYTVSDSNGGSDTAKITVTINGMNDVPVAMDDTYNANEDEVLDVTLSNGVLANDTDIDSSDTLRVDSVDTSGTSGTVTLNPDGSFTYNPNGEFDRLAVGEKATDKFGYTVSDSNSGSDKGTVVLTITGVKNNAPVAKDDEYSTDERTARTVEAPGVLTNDTDVDNDDYDLFVDVGSSDKVSLFGGQVGIKSDGSFTYTPDDQFCGYDSFTYIVSDPNGATDMGTVDITVNCRNQRSIESTDLNFVLNGMALSGSLSMSNASDGPYDVQIVGVQIGLCYRTKKGKDGEWTEIEMENCILDPSPLVLFSDDIEISFTFNLKEEVPSDAVSVRVTSEVEIFGSRKGKTYFLLSSQEFAPPDAPLTAPAQLHTVPDNTGLSSNFPNPSNPDTWIPYQLAEDLDVTIRIHNTIGKLIRILDLGCKSAGFYTDKSKAAHWDGKNEAGEQVSSGVYFYTIQAGAFTATRKMVVAK